MPTLAALAFPVQCFVEPPPYHADIPHSKTVSTSAEVSPLIPLSGKPRAIRSARPPPRKACPAVNALRLRPSAGLKGRNPNSPKGQKNESR
jgi:hypothetical protein